MGDEMAGNDDEQRAASNERRCNGQRAAKRRGDSGVPNKPMVLTALTTTEERSPGSWRQHIGEPLGSQRRGSGRR